MVEYIKFPIFLRKQGLRYAGKAPADSSLSGEFLSTTHLPYRNDLQGLRAIAVIAVLIFHVWPKIFRGGFVGVDVFFVISGFLITSLLIAEGEATGRVSLLRFWARRLMRLLPAASVVLLAALVGAIFFLPRTELVGTAYHTMAAALYYENWALVSQAVDYWAQGTAPSPVQHFWSLSIEEQFYFAWPPLVALAAFIAHLGRASLRSLALPLLLIVFFSSLVLSVLPIAEADAAYFKTTTRLWELALGAITAVWGTKLEIRQWVRALLGWLGLVMVVAAILWINETMRFPGWVALLPTLGTAFMIVGHDAPYAPFRLLSLRPMVYIGDISYAIYLWHWPVIAFLRPFGEQVLKPTTAAIAVATTFALAIVTKYLIEDPFRHGRLAFHMRLRSRAAGLTAAFAMAAVMIAVTASVSAYTGKRQNDINEALIKQNFESAIADKRYPGAAAMDAKYPAAVPAGVPLKPNPQIAEMDMRYRYRDCMNMGKVCTFGNPDAKFTVVLAGDSHAMHYAPSLETIAKKNNWKLLVMVKVACPLGEFPLYSEGKYRGDCDLWRPKVLRWVAEAKPDFVITSGGLTGVYGGLPTLDKQIAGYRKIWDAFLAQGSKVIVMRDNPLMKYSKGWEMKIPPCLVANANKVTACTRPRQLTLDSMPDAMVRAAENMKGVSVIDLIPYLCNKDTCPPVIGNVVVYRDAHHITETYMNTLTPYIEDALLRLMRSYQAPRRLAEQTETQAAADKKIQ